MHLGRYIRAVSGHNTLCYHLHTMDSSISPICRFCLQKNEEFHHLARDCPPLWWERHGISAQESNSPEHWTPQQIIDFTFIPKIDDAFTKPLHQLSTSSHNMELDADGDNPDAIDDPDHNSHSEAESMMDASVMDVSSEEDSSEYDDGMSIVSIMSEQSNDY